MFDIWQFNLFGTTNEVFKRIRKNMNNKDG